MTRGTGHIFSFGPPCTDSMPGRLSFDRIATIYDETRRLAPRTMARLLAVLVDELQGKKVLEVGVGTGRFAVPLQKSGMSVVGVDISRRMVEFGLAKGLRDVVFADGARLPFVSRSFDVATTNHVLHLIPDWRDAFAAPIVRLAARDLGPPPHCIVVPGSLHFLEKEALVAFAGAPQDL